MERLPEQDDPPVAEQLKELQVFAGFFNWLATRTRPDVSYRTSFLASTSSKQAAWSQTLARNVLRYLASTIDEGLVMSAAGSEKNNSGSTATQVLPDLIHMPRMGWLSYGAVPSSRGGPAAQPCLRSAPQRLSYVPQRWVGRSPKGSDICSPRSGSTHHRLTFHRQSRGAHRGVPWLNMENKILCYSCASSS